LREFQKQVEDIDVVDSIREIEVIQDGEPPSKSGEGISPVEIHRMAEIEQEVRDLTGNEFKPADSHPDGHKRDRTGNRHALKPRYVSQIGPETKKTNSLMIELSRKLLPESTKFPSA
jgi:hypothetical protein